MQNTSNLQILLAEADSFKYHDPDDEYLYHVTSTENAERICAAGFSGTSRKMFGLSYREHSKNRVFLTEKSGVMFWMARVEDQLFDQFDDPPDIAILKIPKALLQSHLSEDKIGSTDSRHGSYFVSLPVMNELLASPINNEVEFDENFKLWFGESKIVDQDGSPLVVYHGTAENFAEFRASPGWFGEGMYFTNNADFAADFATEIADEDVGGENIIPVILSIKRPFVFIEKDESVASNIQLMRELGFSESSVKQLVVSHEQAAFAITEKLKSQGFDGIHATTIDGEVEYVAFHSHQIKFAIARNWDYDIEERLSQVVSRTRGTRPRP